MILRWLMSYNKTEDCRRLVMWESKKQQRKSARCQINRHKLSKTAALTPQRSKNLNVCFESQKLVNIRLTSNSIVCNCNVA